MNNDKKYTGRGLEESWRATAMPADESPPRHRLRGGCHADMATLHSGGQATHPEIDRCLYHGGQPGDPTSRRMTLRLHLSTWDCQCTEGVFSVLTPQKQAERYRPGYPRNSNRPSASSTFQTKFRYCYSFRTLYCTFDEQADLKERKNHNGSSRHLKKQQIERGS